MPHVPSRRPFVALACAAAVLAVAGCSGEEPDPTATTPGVTTPGEAPVEVPSQSPLPSADAGQDEVPAADVPTSSGLRLAEDLDTNAPVDAASLPGGVRVTHVQGLRRLWNERSVAVDGVRRTGEASCTAGEGDVWLGVIPVAGSDRLLVTLGVGGGAAEVSCTFDEASVVVDAATQDVLGDDQVALLL